VLWFFWFQISCIIYTLQPYKINLKKEKGLKKSFVDMVQCPSCENELALTSEKEMEDEVIEGKLTCLSCCQEFPIQKSIPNFLPPDLK